MKVDFHFEAAYSLDDEVAYSNWISRIVSSEGKQLGNLNYIFCNDKYLNELNIKYLEHFDFTDIITFNYCTDNLIEGDIFISIERVKENAFDYKVSFDNELRRVMAHGVLHLLDYNDKTEADKTLMRTKENEMIQLFHVEQ